MKKSLKILLFLCVFLLIIASVSICYASNIRSSEITFDQFDESLDMEIKSNSFIELFFILKRIRIIKHVFKFF